MFKKKTYHRSEQSYHPYCTPDIPEPPEAMKVPHPPGVPHFDEWIEHRFDPRDRLLAAARCQFMDVVHGALNGTIFISVNQLLFIIVDRVNPENDIIESYGWNEVEGWSFGFKECTNQHPFYRVNRVFSIDGANAIRLVTESRKTKGRHYIHNITSINCCYFHVFAAMLDAVFRMHHRLDRPDDRSYCLTCPPQKEVEELDAGALPQSPASRPTPAELSATLKPAPLGPVTHDKMVETRDPQMMANPTLSGLMMPNPMMMQQIHPSPMLMQQMQNPMMMMQQQMMIQRQQQQMMMMNRMIMQNNEQIRKQMMAMQAAGVNTGGSGVSVGQTELTDRPAGASETAPKKDEEQDLCVICTDNRPTHVFVPCGHMVLCESCAGRYSVKNGCPICRAPCTSLMKVYR